MCEWMGGWMVRRGGLEHRDLERESCTALLCIFLVLLSSALG